MDKLSIGDIAIELNKYFIQFGYMKNKRIWYLEKEQTVALIELDKLTWGKIFQIYFGIYIKNIENDGIADFQNIKFTACHLECGLTALIEDKGERKNYIERLTDYDNITAIQLKENIIAIEQLILKNNVLILFDSLTTLGGIKNYIETKQHYHKFMTHHFTAETIMEFCNAHIVNIE